MMDNAGRWACLVGPQAAGKTVFADYLRGYVPGEAHRWSMVPHMRAATGDLLIRAVHEVARAGIWDEPGRETVQTPGRRFARATGTKDIVQLQASVGRDIGPQLSIPVFDVPGEWARWAQGTSVLPSDPMPMLLERTGLFVVFVSFWGLLPGSWIDNNVRQVLGTEIWGLSLAGGVGGSDPILIRQAIDAIQADVGAWLRSILSFGAKDMDILIVLSQFQESTVVPLLNAFDPGLGTETWDRYHAILTEAAPRRVALHDLARRISMTEDVGRTLLQRIEARSKQEGLWNDRSIAAELIRLGDPNEQRIQLERKNRAKVRSLSILPMNVLAINEANATRWYDERIGDGLEDFRMCEDVLWWLMLHLKAHEFWRP
jgi:hypothetical protein